MVAGLAATACVHGVPPPLVPSNTVIRVTGTNIVAHPDMYAALRACQNGDTVLIGPGTHRMVSPGPEWLMTGKTGVRIVGAGMPVIEIVEDGASYQMGIQIPHNSDMMIEGINVHVKAGACNNKLLYGMVLTGCRNVLVSNCVFQCDLRGTNSVFKCFVAVNGATNITVVDTAILTFDHAGQNTEYCIASHDAAPPLFSNVLFSATSPGELTIGPVRVLQCRAPRAFKVQGQDVGAAGDGEIAAHAAPSSRCIAP